MSLEESFFSCTFMLLFKLVCYIPLRNSMLMLLHTFTLILSKISLSLPPSLSLSLPLSPSLSFLSLYNPQEHSDMLLHPSLFPTYTFQTWLLYDCGLLQKQRQCSQVHVTPCYPPTVGHSNCYMAQSHRKSMEMELRV